MSIQTILTAIVFVLSVVAIVFGLVVKHIARETEDLCEEVNLRNFQLEAENNGLKAVQTLLKLEIEYLQKKLGKEEDCKPCRPRTCCGTAGDKVVMCVPERKCEDEITEKDWWKNQYSELRAKYDVVVVENKKLEEKYERLRESIKTIERVSGYCDKKKGE